MFGKSLFRLTQKSIQTADQTSDQMTGHASAPKPREDAPEWGDVDDILDEMRKDFDEGQREHGRAAGESLSPPHTPKVKEWTKDVIEEDENGMARLHHIKLNENFAGVVLSGEKCSEVRFNDRGYQKGDLIEFEAVGIGGSILDPNPMEGKQYKITFVQSGRGLQEGFVVLSIKEVEKNVHAQ